MDKKLLPFRWYGGKYSHLDFILPNLPSVKHYVEPYGGSAAVLLNRDPSPVETYNDIDGDAVNFFTVLRDQPEVLLRKIALTPFSRQELTEAIEKQGDDISNIEQARLFFARAGQTRTGLAQEATPGRWAMCKSSSRRGMSGNVSRYYGRLEQLRDVADRLRRVQFENRNAVDVIQQCDDTDVLFYCDPPYPHEVRGDTKTYGYEMTDSAHREMAEVLRQSQAKVAVSGYQCELYKELFEDYGWERVDGEVKTNHATKGTRQESLWLNYEIPERDMSRGQQTLDSYGSSETVNVTVESKNSNQVDQKQILNAIHQGDEPFADISMIAERMDKDAILISQKLETMRESGVVDSRVLSMGSEVWWVPR